MQKQWKSMVAGALVAASITLPAAADGWMSGPTQSFSTRSLDVSDLVGNLTVDVRDDGRTSVQVSGTPTGVKALSVHADGDRLVIEGSGHESVWDWTQWFNFSDNQHGNVSVHVSVPKGTEIKVEDLVGNAKIGDTFAPLHFGAISSDSTIGHVADANVSLAGSGKIVIGDIDGDLRAESAGAGKIQTGRAHNVHADVAGSGAISVASIDGGLSLDIAGSGDFTTSHVNGPTHVDIAGSGNVTIANGRANPLHVDIMGSGDFTFGGTAVDPHVSALGSGNVRLKAIEGELHNDGMANVKIGG